MKKVSLLTICAALLAGAACLFTSTAWAGSCCGGGAAAALILPKFAQSMVDTSFDIEKYDGFWTGNGSYQHDQTGTNLRQYRLNMGYALRLSRRWQASIAVPYVLNVNHYQSYTSRQDNIGDTTISLWYEASSSPMCRLGWGDLNLSDFVPGATFGLALTVPTGVSPYDGVQNDDITGRGFYRLDVNALLDKTIYPWSASLFLGYGKHFERPVNREAIYVDPYRKQLGDRAAGTLAISYETLIDSADSRNRLTYTGALNGIWEGEATIDGERDSTSGMKKSSIAGTVAWSTLERDWVVKLTWNHTIKKSGWGENFPASDIYSLGVTHAFR